MYFQALTQRALIPKPGNSDEDFGIPVWTALGSRFYSRLNRLARKYRVTRAALLQEALALYEKSRVRALPMKKAATTEDTVRKTFGSYARTWWEGLTPEQRKIESKKRSDAAKARWKKKL